MRDLSPSESLVLLLCTIGILLKDVLVTSVWWNKAPWMRARTLETRKGNDPFPVELEHTRLLAICKKGRPAVLDRCGAVGRTRTTFRKNYFAKNLNFHRGPKHQIPSQFAVFTCEPCCSLVLWVYFSGPYYRPNSLTAILVHL